MDRYHQWMWHWSLYSIFFIEYRRYSYVDDDGKTRYLWDTSNKLIPYMTCTKRSNTSNGTGSSTSIDRADAVSYQGVCIRNNTVIQCSGYQDPLNVDYYYFTRSFWTPYNNSDE